MDIIYRTTRRHQTHACRHHYQALCDRRAFSPSRLKAVRVQARKPFYYRVLLDRRTHATLAACCAWGARAGVLAQLRSRSAADSTRTTYAVSLDANTREAVLETLARTGTPLDPVLDVLVAARPQGGPAHAFSGRDGQAVLNALRAYPRPRELARLPAAFADLIPEQGHELLMLALTDTLWHDAYPLRVAGLNEARWKQFALDAAPPETP